MSSKPQSSAPLEELQSAARSDVLNAIEFIRNAVLEVRSTRNLDSVIKLGMASRVLWMEFWNCFLLEPQIVRELREPLEQVYDQACKVVSDVVLLDDPRRSDLQRNLQDSIRFRQLLLNLTFTHGKQEVLRRTDERRRELELRGVPVN